MAINHYENFPVASVLLPRHLRQPISVIYAFARQADDFADEGDAPNEVRIAQLDDFHAELAKITAGAPIQSPLFQEISVIIKRYALPIRLFHDLLDAFAQDVVKKRYSDFPELLDYCRRSANPVGRLLLHLYDKATEQNLAYSDAICSSLQLINFWQDIAIDFEKNRIYIPQDDMLRFKVSETAIATANTDHNWRALFEFEIERSRKMLESGAPLGRILPGRIGLEMRMIIQGGLRIVEKLHKTRGDIFNQRPVLTPIDWLLMFGRSLSK